MIIHRTIPAWATGDHASPPAARATLHITHGEEIYAQGEPADLIYSLVAGVARTSHLLPDGRRQIGDFYYAGDLIGVEPGRDHRFSAEAIVDCEVTLLRRRGSAAYGSDTLEPLVADALRHELVRTQSHLLLLSRTSACERVARFVEDQLTREPCGRFVLAMSRQDMADYLGLTIETVSRVLGRLQDQGVLAIRANREVTVQRPAALHALAAS